MPQFKHLKGKTLDEQLKCIDDLFDVVLRRDRLKEEKITKMLKKVKDKITELTPPTETVKTVVEPTPKLLTEKTDAPS